MIKLEENKNYAIQIGLYSILCDVPIHPYVFEALKQGGYIEQDAFEPLLSQKGKKELESLMNTSSEPESINYERLAMEMRKCFPKGKKPGTAYYWGDSVPGVASKLKLLVKKFGNCFTEEQAIKAAKDYVASFNGNYQYMRLLPYFILKYETKIDEEGKGNKVLVSEMLSYIQNEGQENNSDDWNIAVR